MKDRLKLLGAPYRAPALRVGDRATSLYSDCEIIVTGWTDAPMSWPRMRLHIGYLVIEDLK